MKRNVLLVLVCISIAFAAVSCVMPHVHNFGGWVVDKDATVFEEGSKHRTCSECGDKETETIPIKDTDTWNGKAFAWETNYTTSATTGFLEEDANNTAKGAKTDIEKYLSNANAFIEAFETEFLDTGKIKVISISDDGRSASLEVYTADALASLGFVDKYFAAQSIVEKCETEKNGKYYFLAQNTSADCQIKVVNDMDLNGTTYNWTPVYCKYSVDFDNHTVSNLKCEKTDLDGVGLFSKVMKALSNLKITNATVEGKEAVGIALGRSYGSVQNVEVSNSTVTGEKYVGGITGSGYTNISNCTVENVTATCNKCDQVGGIIGYLTQHSVIGCTVKNCTLIDYLTTGETEIQMGGIAGKTYNKEGDSSITGCTVSKVAFKTVDRTTDDTNTEEKAVTPTSNIGCSADNYLGYICGGKYINNEGPAKETIEASYTKSEGVVYKSTINGNTVEK